jgi:hypothetical protein
LSAHASTPATPGDQTRCAACHNVQGFSGAAISHDRTGFPLRGAHAKVSCQECHAAGFDTALSTRCAGCHRDRHGGELGQRCEGCHDEASWRSRFDAEAHRRTNFPLSGRHAFVPCEECHLDVRDRGFSRATLSCYDCHLADLQRTALGSFSHLSHNVGTACQDCHDPSRFTPAHFPAHDACFEISAGPHASIRCLGCHTRLDSAQASGTCFTGTAACTNCHTHACSATNGRHANVPGYQCKDRKCYECHRFAQGG